MSTKFEPVTGLLVSWRDGDQSAADKLVPLVYEELHRIASHGMRAERPDHTLQPAALLHETYLKLSGLGLFRTGQVNWQTRAHFFAAARQVRRILVNHARDRNAAKRGGEMYKLPLTAGNEVAGPCARICWTSTTPLSGSKPFSLAPLDALNFASSPE